VLDSSVAAARAFAERAPSSGVRMTAARGWVGVEIREDGRVGARSMR
jgi:hypothetical protein